MEPSWENGSGKHKGWLEFLVRLRLIDTPYMHGKCLDNSFEYFEVEKRVGHIGLETLAILDMAVPHRIHYGQRQLWIDYGLAHQ